MFHKIELIEHRLREIKLLTLKRRTRTPTIKFDDFYANAIESLKLDGALRRHYVRFS